MAYLTLLDWSRRVGPDGSIDDIAELLSQCNEVFKDMLWREGNLPTGHKGTIRTGLPTPTWRAAYAGVGYTKSTTAQIEVGVGHMAMVSQIDKVIAELDGDIAAVRMSEDNAHLEAMSQTMATTLFYGNTSTNPSQFIGFLSDLQHGLDLDGARCHERPECRRHGFGQLLDLADWLG